MSNKELIQDYEIDLIQVFFDILSLRKWIIASLLVSIIIGTIFIYSSNRETPSVWQSKFGFEIPKKSKIVGARSAWLLVYWFLKTKLGCWAKNIVWFI